MAILSFLFLTPQVNIYTDYDKPTKVVIGNYILSADLCYYIVPGIQKVYLKAR